MCSIQKLFHKGSSNLYNLQILALNMVKKTWEKLGEAAIKGGTEIVKGLAGKVKENIDEKIMMYKKRISLRVWESVFFIFGFVLLAIGVMKYLGKYLSIEMVYILFGLLFLIVGWIFSKNSEGKRK